MIKSQTSLVNEYTYISKLDDALDRPEPPADPADPDQAKAYAEALTAFDQRWEQYLDGAVPQPPLKPGSKPTIFHLRPLRLREIDWLTRRNGTAVDAARVGLVKVDDLDVPGWTLKHSTTDDGVKVANLDAAPDQLWLVFADVGQRVIARSQIGPK